MHVEPQPTPLIKSKHDDKSEKNFVKLKLRRDPTSNNSELYEFKMALFDNGDLDKFFLFVQNFNLTFFSVRNNGDGREGAISLYPFT